MNTNTTVQEKMALENAVVKEKVIKEVHINIFYKFIKRILDIIGGLLGTILLIPITLVVVVARIATGENNGPVFYEQLRIGKNGKVFRLFKFRSMVIGADEALEKYLAENEEARKEYKEYKKLKEDPRITKVGKIIRKTSIDECPQFLNVLFGQMSLVGPRPYLPREKEDMNGYYETIVSVKPGLTGYWQIRGRNDVTFKERMEMDLKYCEKATFGVDLKIIFKTILKVFKKDGAL